jgi:cytochrome c556
VAFIASTSGVEDRRTQTPAQWQALRVSALQLVEAATLLESPGLTMGSAEAAPGSGELSRAEIQRRMTASHEEFTRRARTLGRTARQALASIDARDAEALMAAGGAIDDACEACHVIYWYPDQAASRR